MNADELILQTVEARARRRSAELAGAYLEAEVEEREAIQAGIAFERWLAEACEDVRLRWPGA